MAQTSLSPQFDNAESVVTVGIDAGTGTITNAAPADATYGDNFT